MLVKAGDFFASAFTVFGAFLLTRMTLLQACHFLAQFTNCFWRLKFAPIRECGKIFNTNVDTDSTVGRRKLFNFLLTKERRKPLTAGVLRNGNGVRNAGKRARPLNFNWRFNLREEEAFAFQPKGVAHKPRRTTVFARLKAGICRPLLKEIAECNVQVIEALLQANA